ncbi:hypothetical protein C2W62_06500 [Candidatus Entotheonella serta]|nr:hypothetical protein C2W62_06500 [Candidatus Entotheonella serta]
MHDGVTLEQQGLPTATIITSVFLNTAQAYTQLLGVPDFPYLVCPHPITNVAGAALEERARDLAPQVIWLLLEGRT